MLLYHILPFLALFVRCCPKKNFVSLILGTVGGTVNTKVGEIAGEVGMTPAGWNGGIFNMIRGLSETVIVPIAGIRLFRVADIVNGGFQR